MTQRGRKETTSAGRGGSGEPGDGRGRRDQVGGSGVYPASGPDAPEGAEVRTPAGWGQGGRGAAGHRDSGRSEAGLPAEPSKERGEASGRTGERPA